MNKIDFRSDTVSHPTAKMRAAMAEAIVGDDVYGEDPTVNQLQDLAADMLGKEAALFVPSGTMANIAAIVAHTQRGDEVICGQNSHIFLNEQASLAVVGGVQAHTLPEEQDGTLALDRITGAIRTLGNPHYPITRVIAIENTHNVMGGVPLTPAYTQQVGELAKQHNLKLHIDGARLFNAAVALDVDVKDLVAPADSVYFCLSKGLSAPVGSMICGSKDFIAKVLRVRKLMGGGMRQAGILAAAGILAMTEMVAGLATDHANAERLAVGLATIKGVHVHQPTHRTNLVYFDLTEDFPLDGAGLTSYLAEHDILMGNMYGSSFRAATHHWITAAHITKTLELVVQAAKAQ